MVAGQLPGQSQPDGRIAALTLLLVKSRRSTGASDVGPVPERAWLSISDRGADPWPATSGPDDPRAGTARRGDRRGRRRAGRRPLASLQRGVPARRVLPPPPADLGARPVRHAALRGRDRPGLPGLAGGPDRAVP